MQGRNSGSNTLGAYSGLDRRRFLTLLGGVVGGAALGSLAGCGPSSPNSGGGNSGAPATPGKKVTVTIWDTEPNADTGKAYDAIIADFQKQYKDIVIERQGLAWSDLENKLQASLAAGSPPTLSHGQVYTMSAFRNKGLIAKLDDVWNSIGEQNIVQPVIDWGKYPDGVYGIVHSWGCDFLCGNSEVAQKAGVDPKSWKTWADWRRDMPKLQKTPDHYALSLAGQSFTANEDLYMWVGSNGGRLFDEKGMPALTGDQVMETLEHWKALKEFMPPGWSNAKYPDTLGALATGKATQIFTFGRTVGYLKQYAPDKANEQVFSVWPKGLGPSGKELVTQYDGEVFMLFNKQNKDEMDAGREFLKFFYKKENYIRYCHSVPVHLLPIDKRVFEDSEYKANPELKEWKSWLDIQWEYATTGRARPLLMINKSDRDVPWLLEIANSGILADMIVDVVDKGLTPKDATKKAQDRANDLVAKFKK